MREFKFRGRCAITGVWRYGFYYISKGNHIIRNDQDKESIVLSSTVGQFTGLKDKNGKEIYSNDDVRWFGAYGVEDAIGVVKWDNNKSAYVVYVDDYNEHYLYDVHYADLEVIGNIHENKK